MLCCVVLCCTVLYCSVVYCTVLYCIVFYRTVLYCVNVDDNFRLHRVVIYNDYNILIYDIIYCVLMWYDVPVL